MRPYDSSTTYINSYLNPYIYINSYYRLSAEVRIFKKIIDNSELNYFTAMRLTSTILTQCEKYNIDPDLVFAIINVESTFDSHSVSDKGAVGLMQLLPSTARYISEQYGYSYKDKGSLYDPVTNVRIGIAYFSYLYRKLGYLHYALWAYNYGPRRQSIILNRNPEFTPNYVKQVLTNWQYFHWN